MAYDNQCGSCVYFEFLGDDRKGYCSYYKCYYYPGDSCNHQTKDSSNCYITTIICDVLGYSDDCGVLNTLRGFRNNVLQRDPKYLKLLLEYDIVGPEIAKNIKEECTKNNDKELWIQFYNSYLSSAANYIENNQTDLAIERYTEMVNALKEYYGLASLDEMIENYDMTKGGHGKVIYLKDKN